MTELAVASDKAIASHHKMYLLPLIDVGKGLMRFHPSNSKGSVTSMGCNVPYDCCGDFMD